MKYFPVYFIAAVWLAVILYSNNLTAEQAWWFLGAGTLIGLVWKNWLTENKKNK